MLGQEPAWGRELDCSTAFDLRSLGKLASGVNWNMRCKNTRAMLQAGTRLTPLRHEGILVGCVMAAVLSRRYPA